MLYKYTSCTRAHEILTTRRIRLSQPSDFNDPFELHPEFQLMSAEDIAALPQALDERGVPIPNMRQLTPDALNMMMAAALPHLQRVLPLHSQHPGASFSIDNNAIGRNYYDENFGILSLAESPDDLLMWAHYGNNHKGVVIGFDETNRFFQGAEIVAGLSRLNKVEYNQKRPVLSTSTRDNPKVFLRKSVEWSYEKEWRLIRPLAESTETKVRPNLLPVHLFEVPIEAIRLVITGSQMNQDEYQEFCTSCSSIPELSHIRVHHAMLSKERYELEIHPALTEEEQAKRLQGRVLSAKPFDI
jgi:Protein of unknown function (DUF2971)